MAQVVEYLPSKPEVLSSNPNISKKKNMTYSTYTLLKIIIAMWYIF
jgi:hypothetical protein